MRAKILMAASAMAVATPAFAADLSTTYIPPSDSPVYSPAPMTVVGHLEVGIGILGIDDSFFEDDSDNIGVFVGAGRANVPFGGGAWNLEIETGGGALFNNGSSFSTIGAAAHLWTRLNSAALGAYGGVNFPTGATVYTLGVEGEAYFGAFTLGANTDYNWVDTGGGNGEFWTIRGYGDLYFNPNFRLTGELAYLDVTSGGGGDVWSAGLNTEYRFAGSPFSVWGDLAYVDASGGGGGDAWTGLLGFRVFMDGGMTLEEHDKNVPWDSGLLGNRLTLGF